MTKQAHRPIDFEIRCPVDTRVLPALRTMIVSLAVQMGFCDEECDKIEMAVDEACANVIRHAYKHLGVSTDLHEATRAVAENEDFAFWLRLHIEEECLRIVVMDRGIGIKDQPRGHNSVEEFAAKGGGGGLGVYIIRNFMDEVEYHCPPDSGTIVTMTKFLKANR